MGILAKDIDGDGFKDLLLTGNLFDVRPGVGGIQAAGYGLYLKNDGNGFFSAKEVIESGFLISGQSRSLNVYQSGGDTQRIVVARNNSTPLFFESNK